MFIANASLFVLHLIENSSNQSSRFVIISINLSAFIHLMHRSQSQVLHRQHSTPFACPKPVIPERQVDAPVILSQHHPPLWFIGRFLILHWPCDLALHISSNCKSTMNSTGMEAIYSSADKFGKFTKSKFWSMAGVSSIDDRGSLTIEGSGWSKISCIS